MMQIDRTAYKRVHKKGRPAQCTQHRQADLTNQQFTLLSFPNL